MNKLWILLLFAAGIADINCKSTSAVDSDKDENICCIADNWEGLLYLDMGIVFIDQNTAYSYFNGTVHAAYSFSSKKVFFNISGLEMSPLIPKPIPDSTLLLYDFEKMTMYMVPAQGGCTKSSLDSKMERACVPHGAKETATGVFGSGNTTRLLHTYQFSTDNDVPYDIRATIFKNDLTPVHPKVCEPFYVNYFTPSGNPDSGTMYGLQFMDIGPIKSEKIFDIPEPCLKL
ncbi:uncharacterized protein LOC132721586 [Ruditapes philippinarum]|uniref:uncharacterized protein LOC132721586 n=1 Tax=Ruditapes philippinarum TaxID=129788 RepID=UPI00295BA983|nr:uncharacterized protein LOC132721586 [Ruditapes philippinarum]